MTVVAGGAGVHELAGFRGELVTPPDAAYEEARGVWNAMVDKRPALIARCTGAADVIAAVDYARENGMPIAVRGGAHNVAGLSTCDGGVVVDLGPMKGIRVDPATRTVHAQPGLRWAEFDHETQAFGLATTGGTNGDTGISGLTVGGGFGWLSGKYGMAVDNLLSADVVIADGSLLKASSHENPDLFWGIRGGSGNFGVVTSFEYRLHPVGPMITGGAVFHPIARVREVIGFYREFIASAPDEVTAYAALLTGPGGPMAAIAAAHCGTPRDAEQALRPLKEFGPPVQDLIGPIPYVVQQALLDEAMPPRLHNYWKSDFLTGLTDDVIALAADFYARVPSPRSVALFVPINGAAARVPVDATAFPHRGGVMIGIYSLWDDPARTDANVAWARDFWQAVQPFASGGVYVNELAADEGDDRVRIAFGPNYERLAKVKAKYDPSNLFRLNANVRPPTQS